ncbi:Uncharacterised protein [Segatella copri]|nr:Uncharacterised protein [Segatella copri]
MTKVAGILVSKTIHNLVELVQGEVADVRLGA